MRAWDMDYSYAECPEEHRAECSAGTGTATFKVKLDNGLKKWTITPN